MNTSEILNTAADLIEERGWRQGTAGAGEGVCAISALAAAAPGPSKWLHAANVFADYLSVELVFVWNDAPERTATDVVAALRSAAAIEQARETARGPLGDQKPIRVPVPSGGAR